MTESPEDRNPDQRDDNEIGLPEELTAGPSAGESARANIPGAEERSDSGEPHDAQAVDASGAQQDSDFTVTNQDSASIGDILTSELDDLMWLDDIERVSETKMNLQDNEDQLPDGQLEEMASGDSPAEDLAESLTEPPLNSESDQVPDDPDEAIAWLERLAAKQGAPSEELPTVESVVPVQVGQPRNADEIGSAGIDAGEIPEDPDEAMAWLEMLAAQEGASTDATKPDSPQVEVDAAPVAEPDSGAADEPAQSSLSADLDEALGGSLPSDLDEALGWLEALAEEPEATQLEQDQVEPPAVVEEPPTPAVAHEIPQELVGADLLFAEPESREGIADIDQVADGLDQAGDALDADELQYDEAEDAMAWLETLAARQGAPIEELTTVDAPPEGLVSEAEAMVTPVDVVVDEELEAEPGAPGTETGEVSGVPSLATEDDDLLEVADVETAETIAEIDVEQAVEEQESAVQEVDDHAPPGEEDLEMAVEAEVPPEDLAWLDTLGAVDAERWLEAEAEDRVDQVDTELEAVKAEDHVTEQQLLAPEPPRQFAELPEGPDTADLVEARRAVEAGDMEDSMARYSTLVDEGKSLAFLIDDLELLSEQHGPEPGLQRVLGDAYARNGQLRKALESYREALANL